MTIRQIESISLSLQETVRRNVIAILEMVLQF